MIASYVHMLWFNAWAIGELRLCPNNGILSQQRLIRIFCFNFCFGNSDQPWQATLVSKLFSLMLLRKAKGIHQLILLDTCWKSPISSEIRIWFSFKVYSRENASSKFRI